MDNAPYNDYPGYSDRPKKDFVYLVRDKENGRIYGCFNTLDDALRYGVGNVSYVKMEIKQLEVL